MMPPMEAPEHAREPAAPIWRWLRWTLRAAMLTCVACAALICAGFVWFIYHVPAEEVALTRNADGIVVLTGGASRIADAIDLLAAGQDNLSLIHI